MSWLLRTSRDSAGAGEASCRLLPPLTTSYHPPAAPLAPSRRSGAKKTPQQPLRIAGIHREVIGSSELGSVWGRLGGATVAESGGGGWGERWSGVAGVAAGGGDGVLSSAAMEVGGARTATTNRPDLFSTSSSRRRKPSHTLVGGRAVVNRTGIREIFGGFFFLRCHGRGRRIFRRRRGCSEVRRSDCRGLYGKYTVNFFGTFELPFSGLSLVMSFKRKIGVFYMTFRRFKQSQRIFLRSSWFYAIFRREKPE